MPPPWLAGFGAVVLWGTNQLLPASWTGTVLTMLVLVVAAAALLWLSRRTGWHRGHVPAVGGAALVVNAALSFVVDPLGEVSYVLKYTMNAVLLGMVLVLLALIHRRSSAGTHVS